MSTLALRPHPAFYPMSTRGSFPGVKQLGHEAGHLLPSSAEVKNVWSYTSTLPVCLHGVVWCLMLFVL